MWLRCRGHVERDEDGQPVLFAGIITNLGRKNKIDYLSGQFNKYELEDALQKGVDVTKEYAVRLIQEQNLEISYIRYECRNMYLDDDRIMYKELDVDEDGTVVSEDDSDYGKYLETQIKVLVGGKIFANA